MRAVLYVTIFAIGGLSLASVATSETLNLCLPTFAFG